MLELTLVPAYGRDYITATDCLLAWNAGKDFQIATIASPDYRRYTSVRDFKQFPGQRVKIRYNQLADFVMISIADGLPIYDSE